MVSKASKGDIIQSQKTLTFFEGKLSPNCTVKPYTPSSSHSHYCRNLQFASWVFFSREILLLKPLPHKLACGWSNQLLGSVIRLIHRHQHRKRNTKKFQHNKSTALSDGPLSDSPLCTCPHLNTFWAFLSSVTLKVMKLWYTLLELEEQSVSIQQGFFRLWLRFSLRRGMRCFWGSLHLMGFFLERVDTTFIQRKQKILGMCSSFLWFQ